MKEEGLLQKLHTLKLKSIVEKCADLCSNYLCLLKLPDVYFLHFLSQIVTLLIFGTSLKPIIEKYHGDAETFYLAYYGFLADNYLLPSKFEDDIVGIILLTEVANHMLIHLSGINKDSLGNIENLTSILRRN